MNNIQILDCTLRDGGYCNEWKFGFQNVKEITKGLVEANIDIIECGFLTNRITYDSDVTKFTTLEEVSKVIPRNRERKTFVVMLNYGEYDVNELPLCDGSSVDGIRVAFHKKNRYEALELCRKIKDKGYKVFIQAMVSLVYTDEEFLEMIHMANEIMPYSFYIVDSFGMMKGKDLTRLFYVVEHNLNENIWIGFHSHNNMQLAFSNAQQLISVQTSRNLIVDASVYGMGRGAGNLNTELFVGFLNENIGKNYQLKPLLILIDRILNEFYQKNYWGYSLPNYISAIHNAHPNYAGYLDDKKTLTIEDMDEIFAMMDEERKQSYDREYIEDLYLKYMASGMIHEEHKSELRDRLKGMTVLLIAPGKSSIKEREKIINENGKKGIITISVNHVYSECDVDYVFLSNLRRFRDLRDFDKAKSIVTSNIPAKDVYLRVPYRELLNREEAVSDNAGLMSIRFLLLCGVKKVLLAGFDGYSHDVVENYGNSEMSFITKSAVLDAMNIGMSKVLKSYEKDISIEFLTQSRFIKKD